MAITNKRKKELLDDSKKHITNLVEQIISDVSQAEEEGFSKKTFNDDVNEFISNMERDLAHLEVSLREYKISGLFDVNRIELEGTLRGVLRTISYFESTFEGRMTTVNKKRIENILNKYT